MNWPSLRHVIGISGNFASAQVDAFDPFTVRNFSMSMLTDMLKSGASSVAGAVSEKLGIDPATAQGFVDQALPSEQAEAAPADQEQLQATDQEQQETNDQAQEGQETAQAENAPLAEGLMAQATAALGGGQGIMDKAKGLVDQDGDGNPLNDITGMVGKMFSKS
jgi:hypothetical protein